MLRLSCEQNTTVFPASTGAAGVVASLLLPGQCCGCYDPCCGQDDAVASPMLLLFFRTLLLMLPSEQPYIMPFFLFML
jgi:hypothetical protein